LDGESSQRKATTYTGQHNTEKCGHTSMTRAGFEPTILVFKRSKTLCDLERAAIGTGINRLTEAFRWVPSLWHIKEKVFGTFISWTFLTSFCFNSCGPVIW